MKNNIEYLKARFAELYQQWEKNPTKMKDGYEYEKTFVEMWQTLGREMFQQSMGEVKKSRNTKKNFKRA